MLQHITIDGYQRIAYADLSLADAPINVFVGQNEAGKSSLKEAIAFAVRGLSPRVRLKGQYEELVYRGKKNGAVKLNMDGFDLSRTIKDGKIKTVAPLDYPDLLVDLQLGVESIATLDTKEGRADIRKLLQVVFKLEATGDVIRQRLKKDGVTDAVLNRTLPLIKASGFESASQTAKEYQLEEQGKWSAITGEKFGSAKCKDWQPAHMAGLTDIDQKALTAANDKVTQANHALAEANKRLGVIEQEAETYEDFLLSGGDGDSAAKKEEAEAAIPALEQTHRQYMGDLTKARKMRDDEIAVINTEIMGIEKKIQEAQMALSTLECPCCAKPLKIKTTNGKPSLVEATEVKRREGPSLKALQDELAESHSLKADVQKARDEAIGKLESALIKAEQSVTDAKVLAAKLSTQAREVTQADVTLCVETVARCKSAAELAKSALDKLAEDKRVYAAAVKATNDAATTAVQVEQWTIVAKALSNDPDSIPSELVGKTIGPINEELLRISIEWGQTPIALAPNMTISRGDGTPYYLLSESARWRADVTVQLALARLSTLKLVCIDRFDVLEAAARPAFFDMLTAYAADNPNISVIVMGTLKSKPASMAGVKFWWVSEGVIDDAEAA